MHINLKMLIFSDVYTNLSLTNFLTVPHIDMKVKTIKSKNKATKSITFNKLKQKTRCRQKYPQNENQFSTGY